MKVQWNAFQRQILRSPGSVFVSAGAGTGKTRTIVQKYIDLVTSPGPDSGEVLMITFTDKAAGEMKERILRQVEETIASTGSPQVRSRFEALRNRLHFAWISTIHGFCTRLLREFPLEAGLDPSFEVVSGNVQKLRIKRAVSGYFDDAHGEDRLERLRPFFAYYRFDTTIALFVEALSRKRFDLLESNLAQIQTRTAHTGEDKVIRAALPEFRKAFETMLEEYRLQNARENDVDFDDILLLTLSMLRRNAAVRLQLQQRFRTIVVDEFQDTNALQIQIISLVQGENTQMLYVGDGKQSIYRFNGADVRVFQQMRASFDAGQVFSLPVNYRSTPELLSFFNAFFSKVFESGDVESGAIEFEGLLPPQEANPEESDVPPVDLLPEASAFSEESDNVSRYVLWLHAQGQPFRSMVVLLRKMTNVSALERAFSDWNVPYYIVGSRGFFQREEVQSLVAFLRALSDPHDGNVMATFLRSLFCALTDEEFLVLRASHPDEVFAGWKHFVEQNPEHAPLLETFEQLLRIKNLVSPGRLVREIIQRCHFDYFLTTFPDAQVRWVNVHKFVEFCDGFEGSTGLRDFINRSGIAQQVKESEASVENEESDVVRVMTVHQSKGLEFPIVIVPELGQQSRSQNSEHMLSDPMYNRIAFAPPSHKPREGSEYEQLCEREKLREEHEERRLLYVAFTRACNKLALSFSGKPRKNTPYLGFLQQADLLESSGTWSGSGEGNGPLREFVRHVSLPDLQQVQPYQIPTTTFAPEEIPPTVLPLEQAPIKRYISPTPMLQALREGRALFVESSNGEEQETPFKNPGELGKLCHKVLEKLAILPLAAFNHALVQSVARQEGYDASVVEPACSLVLPLKTAGIPLLEKLSTANLLFTEKPLRKHWKDYILTGTVDLLFSQGGEWHLVDFKSSAFHREMVQETYRFQVQFYLFLLQELVHPAPQKGHLIFLRDNHVETVHMQQEFEQELEDKVRAYQSLLQKP